MMLSFTVVTNELNFVLLTERVEAFVGSQSLTKLSWQCRNEHFSGCLLVTSLHIPAGNVYSRQISGSQDV